MQDFINYWSNLDTSKRPFIHPGDFEIMKGNIYSYSTIKNYVTSSHYWQTQNEFHTDLLPIPYAGNLASAKVFILLINPGFNLADYHAELTSPDYFNGLRNNLIQLTENDFPFMFLNPSLLNFPGGQYWIKKFKDYIIEVKNEKSAYFSRSGFASSWNG